jgi:hypothetical protein
MAQGTFLHIGATPVSKMFRHSGQGLILGEKW